MPLYLILIILFFWNYSFCSDIQKNTKIELTNRASFENDMKQWYHVIENLVLSDHDKAYVTNNGRVYLSDYTPSYYFRLACKSNLTEVSGYYFIKLMVLKTNSADESLGRDLEYLISKNPTLMLNEIDKFVDDFRKINKESNFDAKRYLLDKWIVGFERNNYDSEYYYVDVNGVECISNRRILFITNWEHVFNERYGSLIKKSNYTDSVEYFIGQITNDSLLK